MDEDNDKIALYKSISDAIDSVLVTHDDIRNYLDDHYSTSESITARSIEQ